MWYYTRFNLCGELILNFEFIGVATIGRGLNFKSAWQQIHLFNLGCIWYILLFYLMLDVLYYVVLY